MLCNDYDLLSRIWTRESAMSEKYYLTTNPHPRIAGSFLAIISQGSPQMGDRMVKVCSVEVVKSKAAAKLWWKGQMMTKPWEDKP